MRLWKYSSFMLGLLMGSFITITHAQLPIASKSSNLLSPADFKQQVSAGFAKTQETMAAQVKSQITTAIQNNTTPDQKVPAIETTSPNTVLPSQTNAPSTTPVMNTVAPTSTASAPVTTAPVMSAPGSSTGTTTTPSPASQPYTGFGSGSTPVGTNSPSNAGSTGGGFQINY